MSRSDEKGFTLIEILIAIVLFSIVLGAVYTLYSASQTTFTRGQNKVDVQQSGRVAIGNVAREVRIAGYDPSDVINTLSTTAIEAADVDTITFVADVDGDGFTDRVTYRLQGTQIVRDFAKGNAAGIPAPVSDVLVDGVTTLAFAYYDGSDPNIEIPAPVPAASLGILRRVEISVTTEQTAGGQPVTFPLTMDVRLRNLS